MLSHSSFITIIIIDKSDESTNPQIHQSALNDRDFNKTVSKNRHFNIIIVQVGDKIGCFMLYNFGKSEERTLAFSSLDTIVLFLLAYILVYRDFKPGRI